MAKLNSIPLVVEPEAVETKLDHVAVADVAEIQPEAAVEGAADGVGVVSDRLAENAEVNPALASPLFNELQLAAIHAMINDKIDEHFASIKPVEAPPELVDEGAALRAKQEKARIKEEARKAQEHLEKIEAATAAHADFVQNLGNVSSLDQARALLFSDGNRFLFEIPTVDLAGKIDFGQRAVINSPIVVPDHLPAVMIAEAWLVGDEDGLARLIFSQPIHAGAGRSAQFGANSLAF